MGHVYRCSHCRTRHTFKRPVTAYRRIPNCRHCCSRFYRERGRLPRYYVDRERTRRRPCNCVGYHHAHRPKSPCCVSNPYHLVHRAVRAGATREEIGDLFLESALNLQAGAAGECPF